jgi:hypothetical protein
LSEHLAIPAFHPFSPHPTRPRQSYPCSNAPPSAHPRAPSNIFPCTLGRLAVHFLGPCRGPQGSVISFPFKNVPARSAAVLGCLPPPFTSASCNLQTRHRAATIDSRHASPLADTATAASPTGLRRAAEQSEGCGSTSLAANPSESATKARS